MTDSQPKPLTLGSVVRRLPLYFGLALASLLGFTILLASGVHFGIVGKFRFIWVGFASYTGLLFWVVVRQTKPHWHRWNFCLVILGLFATHGYVFVNVLRVYPQWRPIWFWPTTVIEAGAVGGLLKWLFPEKRMWHR